MNNFISLETPMSDFMLSSDPGNNEVQLLPTNAFQGLERSCMLPYGAAPFSVYPQCSDGPRPPQFHQQSQLQKGSVSILIHRWEQLWKFKQMQLWLYFTRYHLLINLLWSRVTLFMNCVNMHFIHSHFILLWEQKWFSVDSLPAMLCPCLYHCWVKVSIYWWKALKTFTSTYCTILYKFLLIHIHS